MISRRALLATPLATPLLAADPPKVGILGAGNRGSLLARFVAEYSGGRLVAGCDLVEDRILALRKWAPSIQPYPDYRALLAAPIDAIVIATPVYLHAEHFEAAVASGKHIYLEKPAAASPADCERILRAAAQARPGQNISFGFQRRYGQVYQKARAAFESGATGPIQWAQVEFVKHTSDAAANADPKHWILWRRFSGDSIVENNIHVIDVMNWYFGGPPVSAHGTGGRTRKAPGDTRDHNHVTFTYPGNVQGLLISTTLASPGFRSVREQFHGTLATLETSENYWKLIRDGKTVTEERSPRNITIDSVAQFVERVATGRIENTAARAVESTRSAILGRLAMDRGREVTWAEMLASE